MGEEEPIELRFDAFDLVSRMRRTMAKMRIHVAARAKKPRMAMTAIAQCGNDVPPKPDWTPGLPEGWALLADEADEADAIDADAKEDDDDMEEATESA